FESEVPSHAQDDNLLVKVAALEQFPCRFPSSEPLPPRAEVFKFAPEPSGVDTASGKFFRPGSPFYGQTREGAYMPQAWPMETRICGSPRLTEPQPDRL